MTRARRLALAAVLATLSPLTLLGTPHEASAETREAEIGVGTELMATSDVTLHQAEIAKGSRVSVTKVMKSGAQLDGLNVALADGYVVKVTARQVHTYFRVVDAQAER